MKPTLGRIVHYQRYGSPNGEHQSEPSPAIVTKVFDNDDCQLTIFNPDGLYMKRVPHAWEPTAGHWNWPPRTPETT